MSKPYIGDLEVEYVNKALKTGWVSSLGEYISSFENEFARYCEVDYALTSSSGTTGLHLVLVALGIGPGDEVIIPDLTFVATANAVYYTGAKVVTADINEDSLCISPTAIENAITSKTKAIIPVHLYGHPAQMQEINDIGKKYNLYIIEDAAEAHGAEYCGKKVGGLGIAGVFSFYGNKVITTGEGGMITTNDKTLFEKMKFLRDHAMSNSKRYWHTNIGFNYRMTNIQAAIGLAQLNQMDSFLLKKDQIFNFYEKRLKKYKDLKLNFCSSNMKNIYWAIALQINGFVEKERDKLIKSLYKKGIEARPFFYPISSMPMYRKKNNSVARKSSAQGVCLPTFYELQESQVAYICDTLIGELYVP